MNRPNRQHLPRVLVIVSSSVIVLDQVNTSFMNHSSSLSHMRICNSFSVVRNFFSSNFTILKCVQNRSANY